MTSSGRPEETFALPAWAANPKDYKLSRQDLETGFQPVENGCRVRTQGLPETDLPRWVDIAGSITCPRISVHVQNRKGQLLEMFRAVVDRVGTDLVWPIKVEE